MQTPRPFFSKDLIGNPLSILLTFVAITALGCMKYDGPKPPDGIFEVNIDLSSGVDTITHAASGFLYGFSGTLPEEQYFEVLKPRLVRYHAMMEFPSPTGWHWEWNLPVEQRGFTSLKSPEMIQRLERLGVRQHIIAGMEFTNRGYQNQYGWPGDPEANGVLPNDLLGQVLREQVQYVLDNNIQNIEWDIWNEPDWRDFWPADRFPDQWLQTWKFAYNVIRDTDPNAIIVGPSYAFFEPLIGGMEEGQTMKEFLHFAKEHDVLPDRLVWHELHGDDSHRKIGRHVDLIRNFMQNELGIAPLPIDIPEIIVPNHIFHPGIHVWHFAEIEKAGVEGACHAVWDEGTPIWHPDFPEGAIDLSRGLWAGHLCHLLTRADQEIPFAPRASWYAYEKYAQMSGNRLEVQHETFSPVNGIAAFDDQSKSFKVLLGSEASSEQTARITFDNISKAGTSGMVNVKITRIPYSGDAFLPELVAFGQELEVKNNRVSLELTFSPYEAIFIESYQ